MEIQHPQTPGKDKDGPQKPVNNPQGVTSTKRPAFAEKPYMERAREAYQKLLDSIARKD